ncbi:MAG TPA: sulfatase, partial [Sphingomicrobium sp.]|nr:sulfatase [Sphingomicrobium sp.]
MSETSQRINRREFGKATLATAALAAGGMRVASASEKRPNILVFIADDAGARHFGCYGNHAIRTPNVDRLSAEGLTADKAMLTTPQCSPSRISMLTGKYPHATGAEDLHVPMPERHTTVPGHLRRAGYFTGHMQKAHEGPHSDRQFDWYDPGLDEFPAFLDAAGEKPFFLWVAFNDPHRPYQADTLVEPHDPGRIEVPPYMADTPKTRADLARYYDEIGRMDAVIGRFLAVLETRQLDDATLVVFLSDNGAPFPREKGTVYDAGVRTPLIFRWPGVVPRGARHPGLMSVIDLAPTFLALAGVAVAEDMQGENISAGLRDPSLWKRAAAFSERNWHDCDEHIRSVRTERYRLIHNAYIELPFGSPADVSASPAWLDLYDRKQNGRLTHAQRMLFETPRPEIEFYDTEQDPWEIENLAARPEHQPRIAEHYALLQEWRTSTGDFPPT